MVAMKKEMEAIAKALELFYSSSSLRSCKWWEKSAHSTFLFRKGDLVHISADKTSWAHLSNHSRLILRHLWLSNAPSLCPVSFTWPKPLITSGYIIKNGLLQRLDRFIGRLALKQAIFTGTHGEASASLLDSVFDPYLQSSSPDTILAHSSSLKLHLWSSSDVGA